MIITQNFLNQIRQLTETEYTIPEIEFIWDEETLKEIEQLRAGSLANRRSLLSKIKLMKDIFTMNSFREHTCGNPSFLDWEECGKEDAKRRHIQNIKWVSLNSLNNTLKETFNSIVELKDTGCYIGIGIIRIKKEPFSRKEKRKMFFNKKEVIPVKSQISDFQQREEVLLLKSEGNIWAFPNNKEI